MYFAPIDSLVVNNWWMFKKQNKKTKLYLIFHSIFRIMLTLKEEPEKYLKPEISQGFEGGLLLPMH